MHEMGWEGMGVDGTRDSTPPSLAVRGGGMRVPDLEFDLVSGGRRRWVEGGDLRDLCVRWSCSGKGGEKHHEKGSSFFSFCFSFFPFSGYNFRRMMLSHRIWKERESVMDSSWGLLTQRVGFPTYRKGVPYVRHFCFSSNNFVPREGGTTRPRTRPRQ